METFDVQVNYGISRSVGEVYQAIVDPLKLSNYFASQTLGDFKEGNTVTWVFDDVDAKCEVHIIRLKDNEEVRFKWNAVAGKMNEVSILLKAEGDNHTNITITESKFDYTKDQIKRAMGQTQGWTDFICSLKAYLYADINLRKGLDARHI